eukprot:g22240.t1
MGKRKVAAMENVEAPAAETPVQPKALVATLELRLNDCNEELLEQQVASRQMHEVYGSARRQTFILQSALLRGDRTTVSETLETGAQRHLEATKTGRKNWFCVVKKLKRSSKPRAGLGDKGLTLEVPHDPCGIDPLLIRKYEAAMKAASRKNIIPGCASIVMRHGKLIHARAFGYADLESKKPFRLDTICRTFCLTKSFVTVAFMMLVEQGKVRFEDPVAKFLPAFADIQVVAARSSEEKKPSMLIKPKRAMRMQHLLTHTSGLSYGCGFGESPSDATEEGYARLVKAVDDGAVLLKNGALRRRSRKAGGSSRPGCVSSTSSFCCASMCSLLYSARCQKGRGHGSLAQVPKPEDVVGEIWQKLEVRFRLAEELCNFSEGYLTCLQLKAFFDTGVLTVPLPDAFWLHDLHEDNVDKAVQIMQRFGDVRHVNVLNSERGLLEIVYYDVRAAQRAVEAKETMQCRLAAPCGNRKVRLPGPGNTNRASQGTAALDESVVDKISDMYLDDAGGDFYTLEWQEPWDDHHEPFRPYSGQSRLIEEEKSVASNQPWAPHALSSNARVGWWPWAEDGIMSSIADPNENSEIFSRFGVGYSIPARDYWLAEDQAISAVFPRAPKTFLKEGNFIPHAAKPTSEASTELSESDDEITKLQGRAQHLWYQPSGAC